MILHQALKCSLSLFSKWLLGNQLIVIHSKRKRSHHLNHHYYTLFMSHTYLDPSTVRVGQRSNTWPWIDFELIISTCEMTELKTNLTFEHLSWMILHIKICVDILIYFRVQNCQQNWMQNCQIIGFINQNGSKFDLPRHSFFEIIPIVIEFDFPLIFNVVPIQLNAYNR